jgi:uncharacterized protein (TIGR00304 family)
MGVLLILAGFLFVFIATILLVLRSFKIKGKVKGGGAIIIGPFPIVFGTDKESVKILLILSIVLVALLLVFMVFSHLLYT